MTQRKLTIEIDCEPEEYLAIANMVWHVLRYRPGKKFSVCHDEKQSNDGLNRYWDELGATERWRAL